MEGWRREFTRREGEEERGRERKRGRAGATSVWAKLDGGPDLPRRGHDPMGKQRLLSFHSHPPSLTTTLPALRTAKEDSLITSTSASAARAGVVPSN